MNRMLLAVVSCLPLLLTAHNVQSVELVGPNEEPELIRSPTPVTASNTTSPVSPSRYGPVSANETLWSISNKLRPNTDVSVYQTLVAIYKTNPSAFRNGDINKIIASSVIDVPSLSVISQQTNAEAFRLLRITNTPAPNTPRNPTPKPVATEVEKQVETAKAEQTKIEPEVEEKASIAQQIEQPTNDQLQKLEAEYARLNEQLIVATESNQRLKLKLQPLSDQINTLSDQVEQDINVQIQLQALIDQYKAEIDAFEEPPFSGPGLLNKILSSITGSASTLLLTILSPLLLLTALFLLILRIKSKRELALKEQELAESTSIMDEEENEFDSLFSAEIANEEVPVAEDESATAEEESNLTIIEEEVDNSETITANAETELIEDNDEPSVNDDVDMDAVINGDEEVIELLESDLVLDDDISQKDLDLAAQWESELAGLEDKQEDQVDLDDFQFDAPEDTPLEPIQLDDIEPESVDQDVTIEEDSSPEAIPEVEELLTEEPVESDETTSAQDDTDIDQILAETPPDIEEDQIPEAIPEVEELLAEPPVKTAEQVITETADVDEPLAEASSKSTPDVEELLAETDSEQAVSADDQTDIDEISEETDSESEAVIDIDELLSESTNEIEQENLDEVLAETDIQDVEKDEELELIDEEPLTLESDNDVENVVPEQDATTKEADEEFDFTDPDSLAKQLSSNAFNEDAELPKFDKTDDKGFIDIDTLLTNEEGKELTEEEFDLDFGLDEFPDVVDSFTDFDTDADGVAAQLDLARAYLEIDEKEGAKTILTQLLETAPEDKLKEVKKLYDRIS
ncbi:FimV/HubP family polar landmark protein [Psychromonas sp. GE-S-Ul-11]|uniref:FimV/HubP family polar landmark protein n=1 Tax=Psychromonas sp. GE-S-Ul-11 TaxID=3241170 RepID=UPI00390C7660